MTRAAILAACLALVAVAAAAQSVTVYQTTPDLKQALSSQPALQFSATAAPEDLPVITVDDTQRYQEIDGFGASLTDAAAWLFAKKLTPAQTDAAFKLLFARHEGIAINFLRQPIGSSDLAVTFYSFDDLCEQTTKACTTPAGMSDPQLKHFSLAHDQEYILPLLRKALAINPGIHVMITPWSPPGWMKTSGSMLGANPETKEASGLRPEFYDALAKYFVMTIHGYQAAGVPVWAMSVQNEPLFAPPTYSGMKMTAEEQTKFLREALAPALAAAHLSPKVMVYDHNWDRPDYPETVLKDPRAAALAAGTAWHHYEGDPKVMTKNHEEFPNKDQWVTGVQRWGVAERQRAGRGGRRTDRRDTQLGAQLRALGTGDRPEPRSLCGRMRHLPRPGDHRPEQSKRTCREAGGGLLRPWSRQQVPSAWRGAHCLQRA